MHKCDLCHHTASVRLSITFAYCVKTSNRILRIFTTSGSRTILDFPYQSLWQYSDEDPRNWGVKGRWGRQKLRYSTNIWLWHGWLVECNCTVIYSTKHACPFIAQTATHQWLLFITANIDDYAEENRTELNCTQR